MVAMPEDKKNEEADSLANFLKKMFEKAGLLKMFSDEQCDCTKCQQKKWEEEDKVEPGVKFEEGEIPTLIVFPEHHRKIGKLLELRKEFNKTKKELPIWKKIIEGYDLSAIKDLSEESRGWLSYVATNAVEKTRDLMMPDWKEVINGITTIQNFVNLVAGKTSFENETINKLAWECRKEALSDNTAEIQEKIDALLADLPEEYRDATEVPKLEIPLEELEEAIRSHLSKKKAK